MKDMQPFKLLIVESPTKAKTIGKYLGSEYVVLPTVGHLRDLPKSKLGVKVDDNFAVDYEISPDKKDVVAALIKNSKGAGTVLLATDPDREGEAISWHVSHILTKGEKVGSRVEDKKKKTLKRVKGDKKKTKKEEIKVKIIGGGVDPKKIKRVTFHEITKAAVEEALKSPREIDINLVDAQQARRVLDRLVGYELSPVLWKKVRRGLSAGRVQSVAVRLICEREEEIKKFKKELFFRVTGQVQAKPNFEIELVKVNGKKVSDTKKIKLFDGEYAYSSTIFKDKVEVDKFLKQLSGKAVVENIENKEISRSPLPPFVTSKLQQAAANKFGWSGKQTMSVAQKLYEKGWISYHRTDSTNLSVVAVSQMREFIEKKYGAKYVPDKPRFYATKSKNAQEAHEAIRPTKFDREVEHLADVKERKLYELILRRTLACQMANARVAKTVVDMIDGEGTFRAEGIHVLFDGFTKLYGSEIEEQNLPELAKGQELSASYSSSQHETNPPPRYSDASLVAALERSGIGRPSTYAPIISTITARQYVDRTEGKFVPTVLGIAANEFLVKNFKEVLSLPFTADMEEKLDAVALGDVKWQAMMKEFWKKFKPEIEDVTKNAERVKVPFESTGKACPDCKEGELIIRVGRFGKFISCSRFPDCKHTEQYKEYAGFKCPDCGSEVVVKKTKKGRKFFGCGNYPTCKWAGWKKP